MPDEKLLESLCRKAIADNPTTVADYKAGHKSAALRVLRENVLKKHPGTVNPVFVDNLLENVIKEEEMPEEFQARMAGFLEFSKKPPAERRQIAAEIIAKSIAESSEKVSREWEEMLEKEYGPDYKPPPR
jgi:hypothetical protein